MDVILDKAGQKGTGKWTAQTALDLGVAIPTISAALDARALSSMKEARVAASAQYRRREARIVARYTGDRSELIAAIGDALEPVEGVEATEVNVDAKTVKVRGSAEDRVIRKVLAASGYPPA